MQHLQPESKTIDAVCETCAAPFRAGMFRSFINPTKYLFLQKNCNSCGEIQDANRRAQDAASEQAEREAELRSRWGKLCPPEYRTEAEGGNTDIERLQAEQPDVSKVEAHPFSKTGMLLRGKTGTCKTRCMWRLMRKFVEAGKGVRALSSGEFDRGARDAAGKFTLSEWFDDLAGAAVLFIDDLGKAPWTETTVGHFFDLVDERYKHGRPIFLTTNMNRENLMKQWKIDRDLGDPLMRRIIETTVQIQLSEPQRQEPRSVA